MLSLQRARPERVHYEEVEGGRQISRVDVFMVDFGVGEAVAVRDIADLPEQLGLAEVPATAVRIVVAGLQPVCGDQDWASPAFMLAAGLCGSTCRGRVLLACAGTVWLDRCLAAGQELRAELLQAGLATTHPAHMESLYSMADQAGISHARAASLDSSLTTIESEPGPGAAVTRTAFLPRTDTTVYCYMSECVDPHHFYLQKIQDSRSLISLERDLPAAFAKQREESGAGYFRGRVGEAVLAWDDGRCHRAVLQRLVGERQAGPADKTAEPSVEEVWKVLLLDTGSVADVGSCSLAGCPAHLLARLPAQAVRCSLVGLRPAPGPGWTRQAGDLLFELSREVETDEPRVLECRVMQEQGVYSVLLRAEGSLAAQLVQQGHAQWEGTSHLQEQSLDQDKATDSEEDWDLPNGVNVEDIVDMEKLKEITKEGCENYLEEQLGPAQLNISHQLPQMTTELGTVETSEASLPRPVKVDQATARPAGLPSLALAGEAGCSKRVPEVEWRQDHVSVTITFTVQTIIDLTPEQVHLTVKQRQLQVQILTGPGQDTECYQTPLLALSHNVLPKETKVDVKPRSVKIVLEKSKRISWMQLTKQKFGWIKKDLWDSNSSDIEDFENSNAHKKETYGHQISCNRKEVKAECALESSSNESENEEEEDSDVDLINY